MTRARDFADVISGNFDIPAGSLTNAVAADGSITTAKLADDAITAAKIADDAVVAAAIADNSIGSAALDLTANYDFTGTVTGTNGMTLLQTVNDTSNVDYGSDVTVFNFDNHTSTYHTFFFSWSLKLTGNGNCHCYLATADASNTKLSMRTVGRGWIDSNTSATPQIGTGNYHRWGFRAAGPGIMSMCQGYIFNGQRGDNDYDAGMVFMSNWHYSGFGQVAAKHANMVSASGDQISRIMINLDGADSGAATNFNAKVKGSLWGVV
tara:strand:- start:4824 stop:5618 length:795 start_codon:yes stop_codon:yes gene_type:complete